MDLFQPGPIVAVQEFFGPGWETAMALVSGLGASWGMVLVGGLVLWLGGRSALWGLLGALVVESGVNRLLTTAFHIPRPEGGGVIAYEEVESTSAFPSGHASTQALLFTWLALAVRGAAWWILAGAMILAGSVARLYLGVHWLADVVAGVALGAGIAVAWHRLWPGIEGWLSKVPRVAWDVAAALAFVASLAWVLVVASDPSLLQWEAAAFTAALALGLPLEARLGAGRVPGRLVLLGVAVLIPCAWVGRGMGGPEAPGLAAGAIFVATLWVVLGVPFLSSRRPPRRGTPAGGTRDPRPRPRPRDGGGGP